MIEIENLTKRYGSFKALDSVTLSIRPGLIGILGPNGAGKTTLFKLFLRFLKPTSGTLSLFGYPVQTQYLKIREGIGYMPERECFIEQLTALECVVLAAQLARLPRLEAVKRAHAVLSFVGLEEERYRLCEGYSTGMKQKLKLACALVGRPKLLLLDEPTAGLDPHSRQATLKLIATIYKQYGISILLSTHVLSDVEAICEDVLILNRGRIVAYDSLSNLRRKDHVAIEVQVQGNPSSFYQALSQNQFDYEVEQEYLKIHTAILNPDTVCTLFTLARDTNVQIRHLRPYQSRLDDLFFELTSPAKQEKSLSQT